MNGPQALALIASVQELLRQQAAALGGPQVDLDRAEELGGEISRLLASLPAPTHLDGLDAQQRERLRAAAAGAAVDLGASVAALAHHRDQRLAGQARAERDGAALRQYLPPSDQSSRYFDERR